MAEQAYQHYCPYQPTIGDLQGVLLAALELAQATQQVVTSSILAAQVQDVILALRRHIDDLSKRDPAAAPTGLILADYCEPVRMAWNLAAQVALAAPWQLKEPLAAFAQANFIAQVAMQQGPPAGGRGVPTAVKALGLLLVGGGVVGLFAWLASRPRQHALSEAWYLGGHGEDAEAARADAERGGREALDALDAAQDTDDAKVAKVAAGRARQAAMLARLAAGRAKKAWERATRERAEWAADAIEPPVRQMEIAHRALQAWQAADREAHYATQTADFARMEIERKRK